jgi:TRAP-type C4-dicarboxylate transport system permease small subunit
MQGNQIAVREAQGFVEKLNEVILFPFVYLLMAVAFLIFIWGTAQYFLNANNESEQEKGKKHMLWGIVGLIIMVSAWSILGIVAGTFGLQEQVDCARTPDASGCDDAFEIDTSSIQFNR